MKQDLQQCGNSTVNGIKCHEDDVNYLCISIRMYIHEHTPEMNGCVSPDFNLRGDRYRKLMGFKSGTSPFAHYAYFHGG